MVFSSLPLYHLYPPPNWPHQQLDQQQPEGLIHAQNSQVPQPQPPPPPPPPPPIADADGGDKGSTRPASMADRARLAKIAQPEVALKCPRCESTNTKFCYYNNYSLSQPRHFCKTCRRYWTRGGTLRNVPVGGGCRRKNKRSKGTNSSKSSKSPNKAAATATSGHHLPSPPLLFPPATTTSHSSYNDYDIVFGATNIKEAEFQIAYNNNIIGNNNINSFITTTEQWKQPSLLQHHQQFPSTFLSNLEAQPVGLYQFERSENAENEASTATLLYSGGSGNAGNDHHLQLTTTVKMEENMDQMVGLSKSLTSNSENNNNEQFWEANNNGSAWNMNNVSISFASASSAATHFL